MLLRSVKFKEKRDLHKTNKLMSTIIQSFNEDLNLKLFHNFEPIRRYGTSYT